MKYLVRWWTDNGETDARLFGTRKEAVEFAEDKLSDGLEVALYKRATNSKDYFEVADW